MISRIRVVRTFLFTTAFLLVTGQPCYAQERLCDPAFEDCYTLLLQTVRAETTGIDVALYVIELPGLAEAIISKHRAGISVRLIVEPRASLKFPGNQPILDQFKAAGIPMRYKPGDGIVHTKMLLFAAQNKVVFSSSNFGDADLRPYEPHVNYVDGAWFFSDDSQVVNSFRTRYDDLWTNIISYGNYANINSVLVRRYPIFPLDPALNFLPNPNPAEDYATRTIALLDRENQRIDLTMFRVTDARICDALIRAVARGVPVRLLAEPTEYRFDPSTRGPELTGAYNIDRMHLAGVQIRMRKHQGLTHQKSVSLYAQGLTIFGSSNWSLPSFNLQEEHNYFSSKTWFFQWFVDQFNRKWNSATEFEPFVPLPPTAPANLSPANGSTVGQSVLLNWEGGRWAHKYDVYLGRSMSSLSAVASDVLTGTLGTAGSESFQVHGLQSGVSYCWRVVGKTMANQTAAGPTWCFTASAAASPPPPSAPMQLMLASNGPAVDQLAALDAATFVRDPFPLLNASDLFKPAIERNTRVMVFVTNLQLAPGESASSVTVSLLDANRQKHDVPAESVLPVFSTQFAQVVFRLPSNLAIGTCNVTLSAHGQTSNTGTIRTVP